MKNSFFKCSILVSPVIILVFGSQGNCSDLEKLKDKTQEHLICNDQLQEYTAEKQELEEKKHKNPSGEEVFQIEQNRLKNFLIKSSSSDNLFGNILIRQKVLIDTTSEQRLREQEKIKEKIVPRQLRKLKHEFDYLTEKIKQTDSDARMDIIVTSDANGKTQSLINTYFLSTLEELLAKKSRDNTLKLFVPVDAFIGAGSGAIPASIAAIGKIRLKEALPVLESIDSTLVVPKGVDACCKLFSCVKGTTQAVISAFYDTPQIVDENSRYWNSLRFDTFKFNKTGGVEFLKLFRSNTMQESKTNLGIITTAQGDKVIDLVVGAIQNRDCDARANVKRLMVAELLSAAETILQGEAENNVSVKDVVKGLKIVSNKVEQKGSISLTTLINTLLDTKKINKNTLIISVTSDTLPAIPGNLGVLSPGFSHTVISQASEGHGSIISLKYHFDVPSYLYGAIGIQSVEYGKAISEVVRSVFPNTAPNSEQTNSQIATGMLVDFLVEYNKKCLSRVKSTIQSDESFLE